MHWPVANVDGVNTIDYLNTWHEMEKLVDRYKTRHIGVANFSPHEITVLFEKAKLRTPEVHQMELHPYLQQQEFLDWHKARYIHVTAYSPLAQTNPIYTPGEPEPLLNNTAIKAIADSRDCTPAQVAIMWGVARGTSVIPKSSHNERITENFLSLECVLEEEDFENIEELGEAHYRFNNPTKSWDVPLYEGLEDSKGKHKQNK